MNAPFYTKLFGYPAICQGCGIRFMPRQPHHTMCPQCWYGAKSRMLAEAAAAALRELHSEAQDTEICR
jgi:hypothetical protein